MPSLLDIDHPCAQRQIADARRVIEVCKSFAFGGDNYFSTLVSCLLGRGITWIVVDLSLSLS